MSKEINTADKERVKEIYGCCPGCGSKRMTIHHIVFKHDVGRLVPQDFPVHEKANLCPLCQPCQDKLHAKVNEMEKYVPPKKLRKSKGKH